MIRPATEVEKEDATRAMAMRARPSTEANRRNCGHSCRKANMKGEPRYIIPVAEVPTMAILEWSLEKGS